MYAAQLFQYLSGKHTPPRSDDATGLANFRAAFRSMTRHVFIMGLPKVVDSVMNSTIADIPVRLYTPSNPLPGTILFFHGGGWVVGDLDSYDTLARALSVASKRRVCSVNYRLAPEHPYPAALVDCLAVTRAAARNPSTGPIVLCGDSAGGNLAAAVANICATSGDDVGETPVHITAQVG